MNISKLLLVNKLLKYALTRFIYFTINFNKYDIARNIFKISFLIVDKNILLKSIF